MKLEERLNEIIEEKDDKIQELENKIEELENRADLERVAWQRHFAFKNEGIFKSLPYPRLEMRLNRISKDNWYSIEWLYGLVYKHDTEKENDTLYFVPLGRTTSNGGNTTFENWVEKDGTLQLPFRDGRHIFTESITFNLPAYIVCPEKNKWNKITDKGWDLRSIHKMKSTGL
jgi:hypothetical protein